MADWARSRHALRVAVVWEALRAALPAGDLEILDAGGGTGGFAVPLAEQGHRVTVVDPSPDSLAALERRAAEAGVSDRVVGRQGELARLADVLDRPPAGPAGYDVVLCHSVLEVVEDPAPAMADLAAALRPGGLASVLVASRTGAVLARISAGRMEEALAVLDDPAGRSGPHDPVARRFGAAELVSLVAGAGLRPGRVRGVRAVLDLVPAAMLDADPGIAEAGLALDRRLAARPEFQSAAGQLHVLAVRD